MKSRVLITSSMMTVLKKGRSVTIRDVLTRSSLHFGELLRSRRNLGAAGTTSSVTSQDSTLSSNWSSLGILINKVYDYTVDKLEIRRIGNTYLTLLQHSRMCCTAAFCFSSLVLPVAVFHRLVSALLLASR